MMQKKLLLHACCAPCLSQCLHVLSGKDDFNRVLLEKPDYKISILFDNPNIYPSEEFNIRKVEVDRLLNHFVRDNGMDVDLVQDQSDVRRKFWEKGAEKWPLEPEKGIRCEFCYSYRLRESFEKAAFHGFEAVATTLTLSPLKNTPMINEIGARLSSEFNIPYLFSDFKKNEGFKKSIDWSMKYSLYRQNYCGCRYSIRTV